MNQDKQGKTMGQVIAKCWTDEGFKRKLLADPAATLAAEGVELEGWPDGLTIKAVENTDKLFHLVIPAMPSDLSDEQLDQVSAGNHPSNGCTLCGGNPLGTNPTKPGGRSFLRS